MSFAENLKQLRKEKHLSQEELAELMEVSRQAVSKWESGDTLPDLENLIALAELYNVTLDNLVRYDADKEGYMIPPKGKHIFGLVTVGDHGQIVIPKKARDIFCFNPGDDLIVLGDEAEHGIALIKGEHFMAPAKEILSKGGLRE